MNTRQRLAQGALAVLDPKRFGLKVKFDMAFYYSADYDVEDINFCGTTCCYAGHVAVLMHIDKEIKLGVGFNGSTSCSQAFQSLNISDEAFEFLTNSNWESIPSQCAERVRMFLEHQVPKTYTTFETYLEREDTVEYLEKIYSGELT